MTDQKRMAVQRAYIVMVTMIIATIKGAGAVVIHAAVDLQGEYSEFLQIMFKQMDKLVTKEHDSKALSQGESEKTLALLQAAPSVTIKGNITDPESKLTLTFTLQTSHSYYSSAAAEEDDEDDEEDSEWRSSSGVLTPVVDVVEPYFFSFVELVFNGILSTVISNFLEGTNLLGDIRLV